MTEPNLLTPEELAERWKISVGQLALQRHRGDGPSFIKLGKPGGSGVIRYPLADVQAYEADQRITPSAS